MKYLSIVLLLVLAVIPAAAQPSLCTVTGTLYRSTGAVCSNCSFQITKGRKGQVVLFTTSVPVTADSNGAVSFTAVQGSIITIQGNFISGTYNFSSGKDMYVPLIGSTTFELLKSVEDALDALVGITVAYAPNDSKYIIQVADADLANAQATGALATGLVKNTTGTGVLSIATASDIPPIADAQVVAGAAIAWSKISKSGSSLGDLGTRSAADLNSGILPLARIAGLTNTEVSASAAIDASKIADGSVTSAEFQRLDATSSIQTQLDGKQASGNYITALTGDVTATGPGSVTATIANGSVSYAKLQDISTTLRVLGRNTAGAGDTEEVSASQLLDWIGSTRGSVLYRGASGWAILAPGTAGHAITSNGPGADPTYQAASISGITIGSTTITGGTNTRVLFNNAGNAGEYSITGTGNVVMSASPTLSGTAALASLTASGTLIQTSSSSAAFASGQSGNTNPVFRLDNSGGPGSGVQISSNTGGSGATIAAISSSAAEFLQINAKGSSGFIRLGHQLRLPDGTVSLPALAFDSSSDSGMVWDTTFGVKFVTSGTARASIASVGFVFGPSQGLTWNANAFTSASLDTSLVRDAAGVVRVGDGSTGSGSLLIGADAGSIGSSGVGVLAIRNGTPPGSSPAALVQMYAEAVSSSSELKVRDEAGNITTLSPHNFSRIPSGPSEPMAWSFYSERNGEYVSVDMLRAVRLLEKLSGEKLVHLGMTDIATTQKLRIKKSSRVFSVTKGVSPIIYGFARDCEGDSCYSWYCVTPKAKVPFAHFLAILFPQ